MKTFIMLVVFAVLLFAFITIANIIYERTKNFKYVYIFLGICCLTGVGLFPAIVTALYRLFYLGEYQTLMNKTTDQDLKKE